MWESCYQPCAPRRGRLLDRRSGGIRVSGGAAADDRAALESRRAVSVGWVWSAFSIGNFSLMSGDGKRDVSPLPAQTETGPHASRVEAAMWKSRVGDSRLSRRYAAAQTRRSRRVGRGGTCRSSPICGVNMSQ